MSYGLLDDGLVYRVDPDRLARKLPERQQYLDNNPDAASALLHHEAGLLQELVSGAAFEQKRSMVIDGSLSDCGVRVDSLSRSKLILPAVVRRAYENLSRSGLFPFYRLRLRSRRDDDQSSCESGKANRQAYTR